MLHGVLLGVILLGHSGAPAGVADSPLSLIDVTLLAPPQGSGENTTDRESHPDPPGQTHQPEAAPPEEARPLRVERPQKHEAQPTPKQRPKRAQAQAPAVSETQREDGDSRERVAGIAKDPDGRAGAPAAPGAADGDGRPFGFSLGEVSGKPKVLQSVQVAYPVEARKKGITGQVLVRFHLDEHGTVSHLHIKRAKPPDIFDRNTLAALRLWRFQPASRNSKAVPVWVELPIEFALR